MSVVFVNVTPQKEGYFRGQLLTLSDIFWTVRDDPSALKSPPKKEVPEKKLRRWLFHIQKDEETRKRRWAASIICLDASNYLLPQTFKNTCRRVGTRPQTMTLHTKMICKRDYEEKASFSIVFEKLYFCTAKLWLIHFLLAVIKKSVLLSNIPYVVIYLANPGTVVQK